MPTILPEKPRAIAKPATPKHSLASLLFNGFLICSAIALTFLVLVTEERYAFGPHHPTTTAEQIAERQKAP